MLVSSINLTWPRGIWEEHTSVEKNTSFNLACRQACGIFCWLMIALGRPSPLWEVPCIRKQLNKTESHVPQWVLLQFWHSGSCLESLNLTSLQWQIVIKACFYSPSWFWSVFYHGNRKQTKKVTLSLTLMFILTVKCVSNLFLPWAFSLTVYRYLALISRSRWQKLLHIHSVLSNSCSHGITFLMYSFSLPSSVEPTVCSWRICFNPAHLAWEI